MLPTKGFSAPKTCQEIFFLRNITEQPQPLTQPCEMKDIVKRILKDKVQDQGCATDICDDGQCSLHKEHEWNELYLQQGTMVESL